MARHAVAPSSSTSSAGGCSPGASGRTTIVIAERLGAARVSASTAPIAAAARCARQAIGSIVPFDGQRLAIRSGQAPAASAACQSPFGWPLLTGPLRRNAAARQPQQQRSHVIDPCGRSARGPAGCSRTAGSGSSLSTQRASGIFGEQRPDRCRDRAASMFAIVHQFQRRSRDLRERHADRWSGAQARRRRLRLPRTARMARRRSRDGTGSV